MSKESIFTLLVLAAFVIVLWEVAKWLYIRLTGSQARQHNGHGVHCFCCSNLILGHVIESDDLPITRFVCACTRKHFAVTGVDQQRWHDNIIRALNCPDFRPIAVEQNYQPAMDEDQANAY